MKVFLLFFLSLSCLASQTLSKVTVDGEKEAILQFTGVNTEPNWKVRSNVLELTFNGTVLLPEAEGKLDLSSPHPLIKRISAFQSDKDIVRMNIVMNGSLEGIEERVKLERGAGGITMKCAYPKGDVSFLDSLKEEEIPLTQVAKASEKKAEKGMGITIAVTILSLLFFAGAAFYSMKFFKTKGGFRGTRKFLIEQLGYCPLGPKMGVSLIKIGEEFVLLGVTPGNISMLSSLPKLRDQYLEENKFERNVFKEAVEEEYNRMKA